MNTMEDQDDDQSSNHSFSVVHRNSHEKPDEASPNSTLEEPPVEEVAKVSYLDFSIGIYQNIHIPGSGPRRFYHDPVVIIDPKSVKSESNELCFKVKMGDPEIRALVLARLLSLESFANINIQLNDITTMPYEEIRLIVKPGSVLKSSKQIDESIPYYIQLRDSLGFILQFEYPKVSEELVKDFKKNPEIVTKKWMLALECKGLALGSGCKPLEMMTTSKTRPTWIFPVSTLPCDFDHVARTHSVIPNLPPRLEDCETLIELLKNEIKELQKKLHEADSGILDRVLDLEGELEERLEQVLDTTVSHSAERDAASQEREEAIANEIKDLQTELHTMKSVTRDQFEDLIEKVQTMTSDYQSDVRPKQARHEQQILEMGKQVLALTNRKLTSAIPIFAVTECTNPTASPNQSFGYKTHEFEMKKKHAQIDLPTGIVTIQTSGIWQFYFCANCDDVSTHQVELRVDGVVKASSYHYASSGTDDLPVVISALLELNAGQKVGVFADTGQLYDDDVGNFTCFSGTLYCDQ